jgi:hypothetical protein
MKSKILEKITHRYNLNGLEPSERVISMCNSINKTGYYRIDWKDNIVTNIEKLEDYHSYTISNGYYFLHNFRTQSTLRLSSSEFIEITMDEIRDNKINNLLEC